MFAENLNVEKEQTFIALLRKENMKYLGIGILAVGLVNLVALLMGFPVMWMTNYLFSSAFLQSVFGTNQISFWQAFWLTWLCSVLFKNTSSSKD
jgi:hypothetical protein